MKFWGMATIAGYSAPPRKRLPSAYHRQETSMASIFDQDLPRNEANFAPLSPLSFIERAAQVYPQRLAVIQGDLRRNWDEVYTRCRQLASALTKSGVSKGDTVAVILPN